MVTQSYHNFRERLHEDAARRGIPLRVMLEVTYRCNFRCAHCYVPDDFKRRPELSTKGILSVIDELHDAGCLYLGFTGGEPFVRKDMIDVLWHAKRRGFQSIIYTNGSLIDGRLARELARLNPNKVDITLPAIGRETFEKIVGVGGARDKVFRAVKRLGKNGVRLGFKTCLLKANAAEIGRVRRFASSMGALHRLDEMLSPRLDESPEPYGYGTKGTLRSPEDPGTPECGVMGRIGRGRTKRLFQCGVGENQAAITPDGKLKMCVMIDHPNYDISRGRLNSGWMKLKKLVKDLERNEDCRCNRCRLEAYCKWCPARGWLYAKDFSACDPTCLGHALKRMKSYEK